MSLARKSLGRILDWEDRGTCVLFGDGAGACVLQGTETPGTNADTGILSTHIHSDGEYYDMLYVDGGPSTTGTSGYLRMEGKEVFRHAVQRMSEVVTAALDQNNLAVDQLDWLIPHQANKRIMDSIAKKLNLPDEKIVVTCGSPSEHICGDDSAGPCGGQRRRSLEARRPDRIVGPRWRFCLGFGLAAPLRSNCKI